VSCQSGTAGGIKIKRRKKILMICYYYPPLTDVGCRRSVAFAKYFKKYGWTPYVLSVKNPDKTYCSVGNDIPPQGIYTEYSYSLVNIYKFFGKLNGLFTRIMRFFGIEIKRNYFYDIFCIPDFFWGWIPTTTLKGHELIKKFDIDMIYVSCKPISCAIIGVLLKFMTGKSLILDFRDQFSLENYYTFLRMPYFRRKINRFIEGFLLNRADVFIVVTKQMKESYIHQYSQVRDKIFTVHNGFDSDLLPLEGISSRYPKFTVVYAGDFYFYRLNSEIFFEAVGLLKKRGKIDRNNFQFLFYNDGKREIERISENYGIEDLLIANPRISYGDILIVIAKSHLQLLRVLMLAVPTKLFDGISLNTPFLATIPTGEASDIIKKYSPSSYIITEDSSDKVAEAILDAMGKYRNNEILDNRVEEFLKKYSRGNLALKLIRIIEKNLR